MRSIALLVIALSATLLAAAASTEGGAMSAGDLQSLCSGTDTTSRNACRSYILGVTQGIGVGISIADGKIKGGRPCLPANLSADTLDQTVRSKLAHELAVSPAAGENGAAEFIGATMVSKFSCTRPHS
jgi:hypothetical protein